MDLAFRLSRAPEMVIGTGRYPVLFTHSVLLEIFELTGRDAFGGGLNLFKPRARELRDIVLALAHHAGVTDLSQKTVGEMCNRFQKLTHFRTMIVSAWDVSAPVADKAEVTSSESHKSATPSSLMEAWGTAHDIGVATEEWLAITPRMMQVLSDRYMERLRQWEYMHSRIVASNINFGMSAPKPPVPEDFAMLHPWPKKAGGEKPIGERAMSVFSQFKNKEQLIA